MAKILLALGGNALLENGERRTYDVQYMHALEAFKNIRNIVESNDIAITHGNGPQVGDIQNAFELSGIDIKLHQSGAMSQGYIGEILENSYNEIKNKYKLKKNIYTIITRTLVDKDDVAFKNPEKPIGKYYNEKDSFNLKNEGFTFKKFNDGYRRIVPSPDPVDILETDLINIIMENNDIPIAAGGGGIPVIYDNGKIHGVDAVIDKDLASSMLASKINADALIILTDVPYAYIDYGKPSQKPIKKIDYDLMLKYYNENQFQNGTMLPKIKGALNFIKNGGKKAIITSFENIQNSLEKISGTIIE